MNQYILNIFRPTNIDIILQFFRSKIGIKTTFGYSQDLINYKSKSIHFIIKN